MSDLVFLDTETTGLSLDDDIWEFAAIRRYAEDGHEETFHFFIDHDRKKCAQLPQAFRDDHYGRFADHLAKDRRRASSDIASILWDKPHIVGAVPNFDMERIARMLREFGYSPTWHYHLIDVENLAVGFLAAWGVPVDLPWDSNALSSACGVKPPKEGERHTALGDARWARQIYDRVVRGLKT